MVVEALREREFTVLTAIEANMAGRSDEDHLELTARQGLLLYTANVADFARLHAIWLAQGRSHSGILVRTW